VTRTALLVVLCVAIAPWPADRRAEARAPEAPAPWLQVRTDRMTYEFAAGMSFELEAVADTRLEDVILRYSTDAHLPVNRRVPEFLPGKHIVARHHEELLRGAIPPSSTISWWWEITDAAGRVAITAPRETRYMDQRFDWQTTSNGDVRVWWYGAHQATARHVAATAAGVVERLAALVGAAADPRIDIVAYDGQADMRPALAGRGDVYEARLATLGARVAPRILIVDVATRGESLDEILAHELGHIVLHLHLGRHYVHPPQWLDEGLAMLAEGPLDPDEERLLQRALERDEILSVRSLTSFPGRAELVPLAYAQSRDVVEFLIVTHGEDAFRRLVAALGTGELTTDEALVLATGSDQLGLYQAYRAARGLGPAATPAAPVLRPRRGGATPLPCTAAWALPLVAALAATRCGRLPRARATDPLARRRSAGPP